MTAVARLFCVLVLLSAPAAARDYRFDGKMSEEVLRNYLSRAITMMYFLHGHGDFDDNLRMLRHCGVKFVGRSVYNWGREEGGEGAIPVRLEKVKERAAKVHAADPGIVLQACVFEIVSAGVEKLPVPRHVFEALGQPVEERNFRFSDIGYTSGRGRDQWGPNSCVPDVSRMETKLFFYWLASSYIDAGCEAIHFGQAELMNRNDPQSEHWLQVLTAVRRYAAAKARRHFVLCDAHVPRGGLVKDGKLLFDFHTFPLRIEEIPDKPREGRLRKGFSDALYGRSRGGITPSGWSCEHLPFLVEFDNYGRSRQPGTAGMGVHWVWGWDEITWFSEQPAEARNAWLRYAWSWVRENDPDGYLQMPGYRCLSGTTNGKRWYFANNASAATPDGFTQEDTIKAIWENDAAPAPAKPPPP